MSWNSETIKRLRMRMGWSHSDLARHLSLSCEIIHSWEDGEKLPAVQEGSVLDLLHKQADAQAEEMSNQPRIEEAFEKGSISQLSLFELQK